MMYRIRNALTKAWFNSRCAGILKAPPIRPSMSGALIVSAVGNKDVLMYLVALKSFYRYFGIGEVMLLVQDDCPAENIELLEQHARPLRIVRDSQVLRGQCPSGGTWERLVTIVRECENRFVIQLDSDTVTFNEIPEVLDCFNANRSFTIGTWADQEIEPMTAPCERAKRSSSTHVQILAEQSFERLPDVGTLRYVRGQSSFFGLAKGSCSFEQLEQFSTRMETLVGHAKWREWGSEVVGSNFLVANAPEARVLPFPKYASYYPQTARYEDSSLVHFEGTNRFRNGLYVRTARKMIDRVTFA